jgi:hypothetical protein
MFGGFIADEETARFVVHCDLAGIGEPYARFTRVPTQEASTHEAKVHAPGV